MSTYVIKRLLQSLPVLALVTVLFFFLAEALPGDAVLATMSAEAGPVSAELIDQQRERLGLDRPWPERYLAWAGQVLQGNLGRSYAINVPVSELLALRLPPTLLLMGSSLVVSIILGLIVGVLSARYQYSLLDYTVTIFGFLGVSVPVFFLGLILLYVFSLRLDLFPSSGMTTAGQPYELVDHLRHLVLPAFSIAVLRTAEFARYVRASMLDVIHQDFITVSRAKGVPERRVIWSHALRNALIPIITVIGFNIPVLLAGAVFIETVFQWPGMGLLFINAVTGRDAPVIVAVGLLLTVGVLLANLVTDLAYTIADPRVRLG